MLQQVHEIGLVYNDLKLDNILVGDSDSSTESLADIRLIDFGLCTDFLDTEGNHIEFRQAQEFMGNMALSSKYSMNFCTLGRRDDLISLAYLLIYLHSGHLEFLDYDNCE